MASQSYLEVVDPGCGSVTERNRENQLTLKYPSDEGEAANR
jgi:hypothetical protein